MGSNSKEVITMYKYYYEAAVAKARKAIVGIAVKEGVSVEHVKAQINACIQAGMADPDPSVQATWDAIPRSGDFPTPEELVAWAAYRVKHRT